MTDEKWRTSTADTRAEARAVLDAIADRLDDLGRELNIADMTADVVDEGTRVPGDGPFAWRIDKLEENVRKLRSLLVHRGMD